jgi:ATP-dependent helicase/nuclease subunit A
VQAVSHCIQSLSGLSEKPAWSQIATTLHEMKAAVDDPKKWERGERTKARNGLKRFLSELDFLAATLVAQEGKPDPLEQDWQWARPHQLATLRLAREFGAAFSNAKRELGGVDFSDLEQYALRLLRDADIAREWQERLRFVFVDEFQDINRAQDAIITALSGEQTQPNRFLVGDVKQSIYRFRLANPKIFSGYEARWREKDGGGARIVLAENFRSREGIIDFVNGLFAALMRSVFGGVSYEADVHLRFGRTPERSQLATPAGEPAAPRVELHLIDESDDGAEAPVDDETGVQEDLLELMAVEREARLVAARARELHRQEHSIWDAEAGGFRAVQWRDIVVLLRSPAARVEAYAKEFHRVGIPLSAARQGFFGSLEVSDLLSLLKLLDNPLQDLPLLAVLRSPLAGFSLDELVEIRTHNKEKPLWAALRKFQRALSAQQSEPGSSAWKKADLFLRQFDGWRALARQSSLSHCLETVLAESHYEALLLTEARGQERSANVRRLLDLAREYDPFQRQGLYRFLRFVQAQQAEEADLEPASAQTDDAVRLMSIHKSKGLEFPVVILAGLGSQFNLQDLYRDFLLHETYGLCPKVKPPDAEQSYPSLAHWLASRAERRELLGEEMRLLYVALTRARDTLVLTGTTKKLRWCRATSPPMAMSDFKPSDQTVLSARSCLDWLLAWLEASNSQENWMNANAGENKLLSWKIYGAKDSRLLAKAELEDPSAQVADVQFDPQEMPKIKELMLWKYPFSAAAKEPAVKRVSTLIAQHAAGAEAQEIFVSSPRRVQSSTSREHAGKLAAVEIGSAHHRFLEMVSLNKMGRLNHLQDELRRLVNEGFLTEDEGQTLDLGALLRFWCSEIGARILSQAEHVHREIPFTARFLPADLVALNLAPHEQALEGEFFVVRGKADLAVLLFEEIWLLDFKTDRVSEAEFETKARFYGPQLKMYALALNRIYRRPVTQCWLHFLALGRTAVV